MNLSHFLEIAALPYADTSPAFRIAAFLIGAGGFGLLFWIWFRKDLK